MKKNIETFGVTPVSSIPKLSPNYPSNQVCETDKLCISNQKPSIESILQAKVSLTLCSHKIICTPAGKKVVIECVKHIKIIYVSDQPCQSVHSSHFDIPFCMYIDLKNIPDEIVDIYTAIEDIVIHQLNNQCFSISVIIFACPLFNKQKKHYNNHHSLNSREFINFEEHNDPCHEHHRLSKSSNNLSNMEKTTRSTKSSSEWNNNNYQACKYCSYKNEHEHFDYSL